MSVPAYQLLAFATLNGVSSLSTGAQFYGIVGVDVPSTTSALTGVDVEITDIDVQNTSGTTETITLWIVLSGFGIPSNISNIHFAIGHTGAAGKFPIQSYGTYYGNIRWFLPQGASTANYKTFENPSPAVTINLQAGGNISLQVSISANMNVGASYLAVWGVYSTVV